MQELWLQTTWCKRRVLVVADNMEHAKKKAAALCGTHGWQRRVLMPATQRDVEAFKKAGLRVPDGARLVE